MLFPTLFLPVFPVARRIYNFQMEKTNFQLQTAGKSCVGSSFPFPTKQSWEEAWVTPHLFMAVSSLPEFEARCRICALFSWYSLGKPMGKEAESRPAWSSSHSQSVGPYVLGEPCPVWGPSEVHHSHLGARGGLRRHQGPPLNLRFLQAP